MAVKVLGYIFLAVLLLYVGLSVFDLVRKVRKAKQRRMAEQQADDLGANNAEVFEQFDCVDREGQADTSKINEGGNSDGHSATDD